MHGMENVKSVFFFLIIARKKKNNMMARSSSFWIMHHFGGLQLYQQRLLAWCLVQASPRFSVRIPTSSISHLLSLRDSP